MKIAIVTDIHIGVRGDSKVFHEVQRKFFEEVFFPYIDEHGITTVFDLGDTFDRRKYINCASLSAGKAFLFDNLAKRNIDFHALVGNHDTYYASTNEINSMNLLTKEYPQFTLYQDDGVELEIGSTKFLMLPWLNKENGEKNLEIVKNSNANILMGHLEVKGFEMMKGALCTHGIDMNVFKNFESAFSGHFHHPSRYGNVEYLGSPYEMTWSDYNDTKGFHIFDTDTRELEFVKNPFSMFHKISYDDGQFDFESWKQYDFGSLKDTYIKVVVLNKQNPYLFDHVIDNFYKAGVADLAIVEDFSDVLIGDDQELIDQAEDTMTILSKYIDNLPLDVEPEKLKAIMRELYIEAINTEVAE